MYHNDLDLDFSASKDHSIHGSWIISKYILLLYTGCIPVSPSRFVDKFCGTNGNYTTNNVYNKNLDSALADLNSAASTSNSGFYNASAGVNFDRANALVLCRGDVQLDICRSCVKESITNLRELCPNQKEAVEWYDECMLRYSDNPVLYNLVIEPINSGRNGTNASDSNQYDQDLRALLDGLKDKVIQQKFATGKKSGPNFLTIYALMQCTPDLSSTQCSDCLDEVIRAISLRCFGIGCQIATPSCRLRYEANRFYNETITFAAPPPVSSAPPPEKNDNTKTTVIIIVVVIVGLVLFLFILVFIFQRKQKHRTATGTLQQHDNVEEMRSTEFLQYDFTTIEVATNYFSDEKKLGQGGFGAVYKGILRTGQEVAVKRLLRGSGQGEQEFKNEVTLVAQLQHRNLVRLLGFCYEGTERLLIYEFVPNASLDQFIFDSANRSLLDWKRRFKIIGGVARGLLYLHEDSRLRIIHRDLKASNVLLDADMNSKIADFGMAKLFEIDETQGNTSRIVGTYGYMAPEYAMYGQFSVKSDVFSFGVLVLEIVSGQKNNCFRNGEEVQDLLSAAWKYWQQGNASNVIDPILRNGSESLREIIRCIHIGLLCVQEHVANRPNMASVVLMLNSFSLALAVPSEPAFFMNSGIDPGESFAEDSVNSRVNRNSSNAEDRSADYSVNNASITDLLPR
ncbi:Cysteine-rich RLK 29 [Heracleum sosnowskyi]|uniref:Cysteine-rich RLK 29 n=1 Tax=Heracleum sosnowskyi TaxID=360622 RepID=A0AAD8MJ26_9APIA|nr:Cysteine-rich RLK 29 [Heracleum sosnowskyi]